jgi:hypothetical protein
MEESGAVFYLPPRTPEQEELLEEKEADLDWWPGEELVDGREYREKLLGIRTVQDALCFLRKYGDPGLATREDEAYDVIYNFTNVEGRQSEVSVRKTRWKKFEIPFSRIIRFQELFAQVAMTPLSKWGEKWGDFAEYFYYDCNLGLDPSVSLDVALDQGALIGSFKSDEGCRVCVTDLFFELANGIEFRLCERVGCQELFRVESQQGKKYCSTECAHTSAMRAWRARKKAPKKIAKKKAHSKVAKGKPSSRTGKKGKA